MGIYRLLVPRSQASILDWDGGYLQVTGNLVTGLYSRLGQWVFTGYWYLRSLASILDWDGGYLQVTGNSVTGLYSRLGRWVFTGYW